MLNRNIFSHEGVYVSTSPSSGAQFFYTTGVEPNNDYNVGLDNVNLTRPIPRVQSASYSINLERTPIQMLGVRSAYTPIVTYPSVNLNFNYLSAGISNEIRLGFDANYRQVNSGTTSGTPFYADNFAVCCISGFLTRDLQWDVNRFRNTYQDKKNIYICVNRSGTETNQTTSTQAPDFRNLTVYSFGDCQLTSYRAFGAVSEFPQVSVGFVAQNLTIQNSGSGFSNPSLNTTTREPFSDVKIVIPSTFQGNNVVSTLLPSDTTVSIVSRAKPTNVFIFAGTGLTGTTSSSTIYDLGGVDFQNLVVQSYDINLNLNREPLFSLGAKLPLDRRITFPVYATCDLNVIFNNNISGDLSQLFNRDLDYDISLIMNRQTYRGGGVGLRYDFRRAKLNGFSSQSTIGANKAANISFITEINPDNLSRGFFMSGELNMSPEVVQKNYGVLMLDSLGDQLLFENGDSILLFDQVQI